MLIDGAPPPAASTGWDARIYALSPASQAFLQRIGAWQALDVRRLAPVYAMEVHGDSGSRLSFSAYDSGAERLATIVEAGAVQRALWDSVQADAAIQVRCPAQPASLESRAECVVLSLRDGEEVRARLLVGADGAHSWVRDAAGMPARTSVSPHTAVVANFACQKPHRGTAFQWFRDDGILAWLPLPGEHFSMVWSTEEANARALVAATGHELCAKVAEAGLHALGTLELVTPAASFPIEPAWVPHRTRSRIVLVGDAAHVLHPLAGQGVNLGFSDAAALAGLLGELHGRDPGERLLLRRFERQRSGDILAMRWMTQGLQRLFATRSSLARQARNAGLDLTDRLPLVKNLLARQAMGTLA